VSVPSRRASNPAIAGRTGPPFPRGSRHHRRRLLWLAVAASLAAAILWSASHAFLLRTEDRLEPDSTGIRIERPRARVPGPVRVVTVSGPQGYSGSGRP
jgi:hypothetical protein